MATSHADETALKAGPSSAASIVDAPVRMTEEPNNGAQAGSNVTASINSSISKPSSALKTDTSTNATPKSNISSIGSSGTAQSQINFPREASPPENVIEEHFWPKNRPQPPKGEYLEDESDDQDRQDISPSSSSSSSAEEGGSAASSPPPSPSPAAAAAEHYRPRYFTPDFDAQNLFFKILRSDAMAPFSKPYGLLRYHNMTAIMEDIADTVEEEEQAGNASLAAGLAAIFAYPPNTVITTDTLSILAEQAIFSKWENIFKLDMLNNQFAKMDFPAGASAPPEATFRRYSAAAKVAQFSEADLACIAEVGAGKVFSGSTSWRIKELRASIRTWAAMYPALAQQLNVDVTDLSDDAFFRRHGKKGRGRQGGKQVAVKEDSADSSVEETNADKKYKKKVDTGAVGKRKSKKMQAAVEESEDNDSEEEEESEEEVDEEEEEEEVEKYRPANLKGGRGSLKATSAQKQTSTPVVRRRGGGGRGSAGGGRKPRATSQSKAAQVKAEVEESSDESDASSTPIGHVSGTHFSSGRGGNKRGGFRFRRQSSNSDAKNEAPAKTTTTATRKTYRSSRFPSIVFSRLSDDSEESKDSMTDAADSQTTPHSRASSSMINRSQSSTPVRSGRGGRGGGSRGGGHHATNQAAGHLSAPNPGVIKNKLRHRMSTGVSSTPTSGTYSGRGKRGGGGGASSSASASFSRSTSHQSEVEETSKEENVSFGRDGAGGSGGRGSGLKKRKFSNSNM